MIVGITGRKGHGKDALGAEFVRLSYRRDYFAAPIKAAIKLMLNMSDEQVHGSVEHKEAVDDRYGITPRWAMQSLGTEWGRDMIHEDVWAVSCLSRIETSDHEDWVVTDTRFPNEVRILRAHGATLVRIRRPNADTGQFENHPSEDQIDNLAVDIEVINDGTLAQLEGVARAISKGLADGSLNTPCVLHASEY